MLPITLGYLRMLLAPASMLQVTVIRTSVLGDLLHTLDTVLLDTAPTACLDTAPYGTGAPTATLLMGTLFLHTA